MTSAILIALLSVIAYAGWSWSYQHKLRAVVTDCSLDSTVERTALEDTRSAPGIAVSSDSAAHTIESALVAAATAMRSGATMEAAWQDHAAIPTDPDQLPTATALIDVATGQGIPVAIAHTYTRDIRAACQLAASTGAPLAEVLDDIRAALGDMELARTERMTAMAGPRMTARVLLMMPVIGVLSGMGLGVDPIAVFLDGGLGTTCLVAAAGLCAGGWVWSRSLIRTAEAVGGDAS